MKINFNAEPKDPKGEVFRNMPTHTDVLDALSEVTNRNPSAAISSVLNDVNDRLRKIEGEVQTLADICYDALINGDTAAKGTPDEKRALYRIAADICKGGIVELAHSDKSVIVRELEQHCKASSLVACESLLVDASPEEVAEETEVSK